VICKICGNSENNKEFKIKEMMFGFRDEFTYFECSKCGCLQIMQIPRNMEKYYLSNYYSFKKLDKTNNFIRIILRRRRRDIYAFFKKDFIGKLLHKKYPNILLEVFGRLKINYNSKILDVGCGAGNFLYSLNKIGFKNLVGVDPYLRESTKERGVEIYNKSIHELPDNQKYDFIMFDHSFEHIFKQLQALIKVYKLLSEGGVCLIRVPIKTDYIWNYYGINWVQIDAPRHFFLHTLNSFELLVKKSGLSIKDIVFDSTEFQFCGSEQYIKNIPLAAENSYSKNLDKSIFTKKEIEEFKKRAKELNMKKQGDQAAFFLTKKV
jgi:2-polyprenyl-3-methyl-5-hydroxy-6-metoxy-1,4-benzoquinol methylase